MRQRDILLTSGLLVTIVVGMFTYTWLAKNQVAEVPTMTEEVPRPAPTARIDATHFFRDGVHTIVGSIMVPTPCDLLTYESQVAESMPEQVTFAFTTINNSEMCATVVTEQRFLVTATASEMATLRATLNGMPVELNLVPASLDETPESFELYFKG